MDETALFTISYGMYILTTENENKKNGCIVNTVTQIRSEPTTMISVNVLKSNLTNDLIQKSNKFGISVVSKNSNLDLIKAFGFVSGRDKDKFENIEYDVDCLNNPIIKINCVANMTCKVIQTIDFITHTMFIAEVVDAEKLNNQVPMTYAYYRDLKAGKVSNTDNESKVEKENKPMYECKVCHYIYDGDIPFEDLPDDYICPICKEPKSSFIKIS